MDGLWAYLIICAKLFLVKRIQIQQPYNSSAEISLSPGSRQWCCVMSLSMLPMQFQILSTSSLKFKDLPSLVYHRVIYRALSGGWAMAHPLFENLLNKGPFKKHFPKTSLVLAHPLSKCRRGPWLYRFGFDFCTLREWIYPAFSSLLAVFIE